MSAVSGKLSAWQTKWEIIGVTDKVRDKHKNFLLYTEKITPAIENMYDHLKPIKFVWHHLSLVLPLIWDVLHHCKTWYTDTESGKLSFINNSRYTVHNEIIGSKCYCVFDNIDPEVGVPLVIYTFVSTKYFLTCVPFIPLVLAFTWLKPKYPLHNPVGIHKCLSQHSVNMHLIGLLGMLNNHTLFNSWFSCF